MRRFLRCRRSRRQKIAARWLNRSTQCRIDREASLIPSTGGLLPANSRSARTSNLSLSRLRCGAAFADSRCELPQALPSLETLCRSASVSHWASHSVAQASTTPSELSRPILRLNGHCSKSSQSLSNIRSGTARSGCGPKQANSSLLPNKRASSERAITPPFRQVRQRELTRPDSDPSKQRLDRYAVID